MSVLTDEQIADGWIEHDGGPCPVDPKTLPGVLFDNGYRCDMGTRRAEYWLIGFWTHHFPPGSRIIAYRPANA